MSDPAEVLTEVQDGVLIVTINRPEAKNAMNKAAAEGIAAALDRLDAESDLRVAILTGAGGTFCSGMDLKGFLRGETPTVPGRGFGGIGSWTPSKPLIAAVDGYALAGGCELAIACDMIVANSNAKFGIPEAKRGLAAAGGGLIRLPRYMPRNIAMEFALTGDFVDAKRAYDLGLVNRVVEGPALAGALELARRVAENGPLALAASKRVVRESWNWTDEEMWNKQGEVLGNLFATNDAREGATAFAEKRKPNWTGT